MESWVEEKEMIILQYIRYFWLECGYLRELAINKYLKWRIRRLDKQILKLHKKKMMEP